MKRIRKHISIALVMAMLVLTMPMQVLATEFAEAEKEVKVTEEEVISEKVIVGEVTEKRESNVKHFLNDDGSYEAAIYPTAVHYENGGGLEGYR